MTDHTVWSLLHLDKGCVWEGGGEIGGGNTSHPTAEPLTAQGKWSLQPRLVVVRDGALGQPTLCELDPPGTFKHVRINAFSMCKRMHRSANRTKSKLHAIIRSSMRTGSGHTPALRPACGSLEAKRGCVQEHPDERMRVVDFFVYIFLSNKNLKPSIYKKSYLQACRPP